MNPILVALTTVVMAALPSVGLALGPSYAGLVFGLGAIYLLHGVARERRFPRLDPSLTALAVLFAGWCALTTLWSVVPAHSAKGTLQIAAIFFGGLIALTAPPMPGRAADRLFLVLAIALGVGAAEISADTLAGYPLEGYLAHGRDLAPTKFNRGADYLGILFWPILADAVLRKDRRRTVLLVAAILVVEMVGRSATGRLSLAVGGAVLLAAFVVPRLVRRGLAAGVVFTVLTLPWVLRLFSPYRKAVIPYIKNSALARLEIWDYMSAHAVERPLTGWGFWDAKFLPIRPDQLAQYVWIDAAVYYPHNQWLQLWVETGVIGVVIGLAFVLTVLRRIHTRLAAPVRPFAHAAFATAIVTSLDNFEISTDSWWAALTATALLLTWVQPAGESNGSEFSG